MNKYLEKIASAVGVGESIGNLFGSIGRGVKSVVKPVGSVVGAQVHNAFGGAYKRYAYNNMGIKNPRQLAKFSGNKESISRIKEHFKSSPTYTSLGKPAPGMKTSKEQRDALIGFRTNTLKDLRNQTIAGRIVTGGLAAGSLYGANKLISNVMPDQNQQYNNYY